MQPRSILLIPIIIVLSACFVVVGYFTLFPWVERSICYTRVAEKIGVNPTHVEIRDYLQASLTPGMNQLEVEQILETLAPIETSAYGQWSTLIRLKLCSHPFNHILLIADFSKNGSLIQFEIEGED